MQRNVYIRADGNPQIGLGHLIRCIALAHMLKDDFRIVFFCKTIPEKILREIESIPSLLVKVNEENEFLSAIQAGDIVVLDSYDFDIEYQHTIKRTGAKLVCIDDLHDKEFLADLIINHAPGVNPANYRAQPYTKYALGPDYALLRPAFLAQANKAREIKKVKNVFIGFGGSDSRNLTTSTLQIVSKFKEFEQIHVVTGAAYTYIELLNGVVENDTRITHHHSVDEKEMLTIMSEAELAIVPASGMLLEAFVSGCIVISGIYVDNQQILFERFKSAGRFISAGNFQDQEINKSVKAAMLLQSRPVKIFDGRSGIRLREYFCNL